MQVTEIGSVKWHGMMSLSLVFALLGRAGKNNFENLKKIEGSTKFFFFRNLAQCDIKLYPAPKTFQGYIHFKEAIR